MGHDNLWVFFLNNIFIFLDWQRWATIELSFLTLFGWNVLVDKPPYRDKVTFIEGLQLT